MKILICDDEPQYLKELELHVSEYMKNRFIRCTITSVLDPMEVLSGDSSFDIAFLDIQMPVSGLTLAKELIRRNSRTVQYFITNYSEYQDDALDLRPFRYFEKPFDVERLYMSLDKAMEYIDGAYIDVYVIVEGVYKRIIVDQILYVTRENRHTIIVTGEERLTVRGGYEECCEMLPSLFFYPVHKSFFVNLHYVETYSYSELILNNGDRIPIAPRKQADFRKFWFDFIKRR